MYTTQKQSLFIPTNADYHIAAAQRHEEAAESHRDAAAHYAYGNFLQAGEHARLAEGWGKQATAQCMMAMK